MPQEAQGLHGDRFTLSRVRSNLTIDWTVKAGVQAKLRVLVERVFRRYGYPPDKQEQATRTVLEQTELFAEGGRREGAPPPERKAVAMPRQRTSRELAVALGVLGVLLVPATVIGLGVEGFLVRFYEHWSRHWLALLFVSLLSGAVTCWIPCLFAFERTRFGNRLDLGVVILLGGGGGFAIPLLFGVDHLGIPLRSGSC